MGILEKLFDLGIEFLNEQKKTNQLLTQLTQQTSTKNDFIIKGQKDASYILGCSIPTLKKYIDDGLLVQNQDYYNTGERSGYFSLSSLQNLKSKGQK